MTLNVSHLDAGCWPPDVAVVVEAAGGKVMPPKCWLEVDPPARDRPEIKVMVVLTNLNDNT